LRRQNGDGGSGEYAQRAAQAVSGDQARKLIVELFGRGNNLVRQHGIKQHKSQMRLGQFELAIVVPDQRYRDLRDGRVHHPLKIILRAAQRNHVVLRAFEREAKVDVVK
jgi:hypothetical protein